MKFAAKVIAFAVAATLSSVAVAQKSESKVELQNLNQSQSGLLNKQEMDLGNAKAGGKSNVNIKNVNQSQSGLLNNQKANVGNAE